jgi:hypothetical protein
MALKLPQTEEMKNIEAAFQALAGRFEELLQFNYELRYQALLRTEVDYENYVVDKGLNEVQDLSIHMAQFDHPATQSLQSINRALLNISLRRDMISKEHIRAIQNLANWQSLSNDIEAFYQRAFDYLLTFEEIKGLKTIGDKSAEIHQHIPHILDLKNDINRYYRKDGNIVYGEAYNYRIAVKEVLEDLDMKKETTARQCDIFQKMKEAGM